MLSHPLNQSLIRSSKPLSPAAAATLGAGMGSAPSAAPCPDPSGPARSRLAPGAAPGSRSPREEVPAVPASSRGPCLSADELVLAAQDGEGGVRARRSLPEGFSWGPFAGSVRVGLPISRLAPCVQTPGTG
uniref:Zinc finger protein ZFPM1/2 PR domain-containing protein n=1 Tax=Nothoprocta perdicaria TaxID=30464 RepID=A0A8C6YPS6_NOTPE